MHHYCLSDFLCASHNSNSTNMPQLLLVSSLHGLWISRHIHLSRGTQTNTISLSLPSLSLFVCMCLGFSCAECVWNTGRSNVFLLFLPVKISHMKTSHLVQALAYGTVLEIPTSTPKGNYFDAFSRLGLSN